MVRCPSCSEEIYMDDIEEHYRDGSKSKKISIRPESSSPRKID